MVKHIQDRSEIPSGKVVIDFFATWCGPCKRIAPMYVDLAKQFSSITFLKCDVDEAEQLSGFYRIESLPSFVFLIDGKETKRVEGANLNQIIENLQELEHL